MPRLPRGAVQPRAQLAGERLNGVVERVQRILGPDVRQLAPPGSPEITAKNLPAPPLPTPDTSGSWPPGAHPATKDTGDYAAPLPLLHIPTEVSHHNDCRPTATLRC